MAIVVLYPMYCCALLTVALLTQAPASTPPSVAVWYAGPGAAPPTTRLAEASPVRKDLQAIRRAGFSGIVTWVTWAELEQARGAPDIRPLQILATAASVSGLAVSLVFYADDVPAWARDLDAASRDRSRADAFTRLGSIRGIGRVVLAADATKDHDPIVVGARGVSAPRARLAFWEAIARGDRELSFLGDGGVTAEILALGETAGIVTRNPALFAPLRPRRGGVVGVSGTGGAPIAITLLESDQAIVIIGINDSPSPRPVRITFEPEIPEAIWQNLETGAAVNFVMGPSGPYYDYTFAPNDTLVLMIRKTLR